MKARDAVLYWPVVLLLLISLAGGAFSLSGQADLPLWVMIVPAVLSAMLVWIGFDLNDFASPFEKPRFISVFVVSGCLWELVAAYLWVVSGADPITSVLRLGLIQGLSFTAHSSVMRTAGVLACLGAGLLWIGGFPSRRKAPRQTRSEKGRP